MRLGTFNAGLMQDQLTSKRAQKKVLRALERIIATCVQEGTLDTFSMCEVGGHLAGLKAAGIQALDLSVFSHGAECSNTQRTICLAGASAPLNVALGLSAPCLACGSCVSLLCTPCRPKYVSHNWRYRSSASVAKQRLYKGTCIYGHRAQAQSLEPVAKSWSSRLSNCWKAPH